MMKRSIMRNPRARRMLDMTSQSQVSRPNFQDENDGCSHQEQVKVAEVIESPTASRKDKTGVNIIITTKKYNTRDSRTEKNYNERDDNNEDFSPDPSEYVPSPQREIRSDTPSTISSIGGDSFFIDKIIHSSNMRSPSTISNLSLVFDNVDFVASPSAIYKISNKQEIPHQHESGTKTDLSQSFEPIFLEDHSKNFPTITDQANILVENKTLTPEKIDITLEYSKNFPSSFDQAKILAENKTLTPDKIGINLEPNGSNIEFNEIINGLSSWASSNNDVIHEDNLNNQNTPQELVSESLNHTVLVQPLQLSSSLLNNHIIIPESDLTEQNDPKGVETLINQNGSRKRKSDKNEWKDIKNKILKNSGEAFEACRSKKLYAAKTIGPGCSCKKRCSEKFTSQQRENIFTAFYKLQNHELQWQYITRRITCNPIKRLTLERKNNRTQTIKYSFPLDECDIPVCKIYFLNTLKISEQVVYTALEKIKKDQSLTDERGKHLNRPHKMSDTTKENIMEHINLFPAIESHYVRKDSKRQYLSEQLNISKMYRLYQSWFKNQNYSPENLGTKRQYQTTFNTMYNFSFFKPKKDLCAICSLYEQAESTKKADLEDNYRAHLERKNRVREIKTEEKAAVDTTKTTIAVFDLEKVLNVPQSEVGIFHYKRKYPIYNFTVFDTVNKAGYCYVWHLSIAKRGANEIGSCLLQFIQQEVQKGIKNISFYSDGCAGQNKNRYIFAMYLNAIKTYDLESITHRFFETGHSQSEGDSMHSCVERAMKNKTLYTPDQVYSVILNAKIRGETYKLKEMEQSAFYDLKSLISEKNWLKDTQGRKIAWSKIMEIKVSHLRPHVLQFKYDFGEDYLDLDTEQGTGKRKRGRKPKNPVERLVDESLKQVYHQPIPIPKPLYDDLLGLCATEAIPKHYHGFYESLTSAGTPETQNLVERNESDENDENI